MAESVIFCATSEPDEVDLEETTRVRQALYTTLRELGVLPSSILNGLIIVYIELALEFVGPQETDDGLRSVLAELPRIAAVDQLNLGILSLWEEHD